MKKEDTTCFVQIVEHRLLMGVYFARIVVRH